METGDRKSNQRRERETQSFMKDTERRNTNRYKNLMQCKINFENLTNLIKNMTSFEAQEQTAGTRGKLGSNQEDY